MPLNEHGFCEHFCSKPVKNVDRNGFCGSSLEYRKEGSTDCQGCKGILFLHSPWKYNLIFNITNLIIIDTLNEKRI